MIKQLLVPAVLSTAVVAGSAAHAESNSAVPAAQKLAQDSMVVAAVQKANKERQNLTGAKLHQLNHTWQQQLPSKKGKLINESYKSKLAGKLKSEVKKHQDSWAGIVVLDSNGANVAQTYLTNNFDQSNRLIWTAINRAGPQAVYVSRQHSSQRFKAKVSSISVPVLGKNKNTIGAVVLKIKVQQNKS